jgi:4,5-dihydroxyphthalate decarboxylase
MAGVSLNLACCDYDRTRALFDGRVRIDGCEVFAVPMPPEEAFHRAFRYQEFDVTELSMSSYMSQVAGGGSPYIGIPVFPSRLFRHSSIYVRTDRGIGSPEDLKGKIVGVPEYQMTAALWVRGILQDEYGVRPQDIRWRTGGLEEAGRSQVVALDLPGGIDVKSIPNDDTLARQLGEGKIDALISARAPSSFRSGGKIARLFPEYRAAEEAYFRKSGMFPIMHLVGIRRTLVDRHPWLPVNVYTAFLKAKELCYRDLEKVGHLFTTLPWPVDELERARALMGRDYWRYGVRENAKEIDAMGRYAFEQGLTPRRLSAEDLFARSTFDLVKI